MSTDEEIHRTYSTLPFEPSQWETVDATIEHLNIAGEIVITCPCGKNDTVVANGDDDNVRSDGMFLGDFCEYCGRTYRVVIQARQTSPEDRRYRQRPAKEPQE